MDEQLDAVVFTGNALAPFFLEDPQLGTAADSFAAFASLDAEAAALEWPFGDSDQVARGLQDMADGLAGGVTDEITWEFRRLFVGPGPKAAPPWGSVYTDHDGVMFGESALVLGAWMRANGITRLAPDGSPDDHMGLVLSLMSWIALNKPTLLDEYLREHVLTWSSHFLEKLEGVALHPFYRGLAVLTRASLEGIQSERGIQVRYPRYFR